MAETIQNLLRTACSRLAATSDTAQLDAEVLLCFCLHKNRSYLRTWPEKQLDVAQCSQFQALIDRRAAGWPIAYLTENREFWSRDFKVSPDVLIPRADSELLIELSLPLLSETRAEKIIDLGAGSGILAITLAAERPQAQVLATDICAKALRVAAENAARLNIRNVDFLQSAWFDMVPAQRFDLVISNPPYIAANDPHLRQGDVRFEPESALISADNGLQDIRLIAEQARHYLKNNGHLLIEHGYNQQTDVQAIFKALNYQDIATHCDLSGRPRVTSGLWTFI
ncbi:MAG: peptide chain release factor N(5)-glutamine methyltransferase [Methylococcales bacterium]|nr:peptide chain release factor N(5)-glutamine methyltransferase [Methylococcales bacterium]